MSMQAREEILGPIEIRKEEYPCRKARKTCPFRDKP